MHVTGKIWNCKQQDTVKDQLIDNICKKLNLSTIIATILVNRGYKDINQIQDFLNPKIEDFYDPFLMKDMAKAVERIKIAINSNEKIVVFGDYDVDGITSTSILLSFLNKYSNNADFYIPDRMTEGYGLSKVCIDKLVLNGVKLIVTVDCGITAIDEINYINSKGIDIIVTDHHECKDEIPSAYAVINPKQIDCRYPCKELAGVGVVFKLLQGIGKSMDICNVIDSYIEIVALGTVADVVPLIGENRIIVKHGLEKMRNTSNLGIKALINISGVSLSEINTTTIGYILAPRINAAGRIGNAKMGVELFLTEDEDDANKIAIILDNYNKERQQTENDILNQAFHMIEVNEQIRNQKIIVLSSNGWHHGVIGIVASRITEKYNKPSILISIEGDEGKGSGRSIYGFNIFEALTNCSCIIDKFGGHELAAGLSISKNNIEIFREAINEYADKVMDKDSFAPRINIDAKLCRSDLNISLLNQLKKLEPYGISNPSPFFVYNGLKIVDSKTVGDDKHLKLRMEDDGIYIDSIGFNMGGLSTHIDTFDKIDVVCNLEINKWNGREKIQMNLKDISTSSNIIFKEKYFSTLNNSIMNKYEFGNEIEIDKNKLICFKESVSSIFENRCMNLILVNTLIGSIDITELIKKEKNECKNTIKVSYNDIENYNLHNNFIVINSIVTQIEIDKFDNIYMYDMCFNKESFIYLIKNTKCLHLMQTFNDYNNNIDVINNVIPQKEELIKAYQYIKSRSQEQIFEGNIYSITREIAISYNIDMNSYKLKNILDIFEEMNLIEFQIEIDYYKIILNSMIEKKINIMDSEVLGNLSKLKDKFDYFLECLKK